MFDISQKDMANRTSVYVENDGKANPRHINHVALRTMHPDDMAEFYRDVFELAPSNVKKRADDPNHYLTDGHMTLVIMPWDITDYDGTGIITAGHGSYRLQGRERGGVQGRRRAHRRRQSAAGAGAGRTPARKARRSTSCSRAVAPWASTGSPIPTAS